jgi:hypothetical protein
MLFEKLKKIEHIVEGDEYISYGASYFISIVKMLKSMDVKELREVFLDLEVDIKSDSVNPSEIEDRSSDFKLINDIWHFKGEIADNLMNIIKEADVYYRPLDKDDYYARGNVNDIFRIVKKDGEIILIEFYACD